MLAPPEMIMSILRSQQEQVAGVVEVADVADREEAVAAVGVGLLLVAVVLEVLDAELHVDGAGRAGRELAAGVVEDADLGARPRLADGAGTLEPLRSA